MRSMSGWRSRNSIGGFNRSKHHLCSNADSESGAEMKRQMKPRLSLVQKSAIWTLWREGESQSDIARALEREVGSVRRFMPSEAALRRRELAPD